jgi:polysaccharide pyruvyl transferase WcaK-like protein
LEKDTKATILLVPFQKSKDEEIAKEITIQIPKNSYLISLTDPRELKGLFREVTMVIGMRLHSLIMAAAEGCNCFALSYDPKVSILMTELNLPGYELEELPSNPDIINKAWLETYSRQKSLSSEKINSLKKDALLHKQLLDKLINNA